MKRRRPLIAGNWKMNGNLATNASLLAELQNGLQQSGRSVRESGRAEADIAVCVPAVYLAQAQTALQHTSIRWGAQDVSAQQGGAYTGDISASMLCDFSCFYTIVGHSERRTYQGESDQLVAQKTLRLLEAGIVPIVCVGESSEQRQAGQTDDVVARQLLAVLTQLGKEQLAQVVVAYEPVWAIGTGLTATPEMAQQVHAYLRRQIASVDADAAQRVPILYGGSMKPDNAAALLAMDDIDGGLIGGASLKAVDFLGIIAAAQSN